MREHTAQRMYGYCTGGKPDRGTHEVAGGTHRHQHEALGYNYRVCGVYTPESHAEVCCVRLNFSFSKLVYIHQGTHMKDTA